MRMRSEQIKYFLEAAETGSMLQVAEKNFLTQPAISSAITKLEEELGVILLNRSKQGITLTEAGKIAQLNLLKIQQMVIELEKQLQPYQTRNIDEQEGIIELCSTLELSGSLLNEVMNLFYLQYPNCAFSIKEYDFFDMIHVIGHGRSEFGMFCIIDELLEESSIQEKLEEYHLSIDKIASDRLNVGVFENSPLAQEHSISLQNVLKHRLAIYNSSNEEGWHEMFLRKYSDNVQLTRTNSGSFLRNLVHNREHVLFVLNSKTLQKTESFGCKFIPIKENIKVTIGILYKSEVPFQKFSTKFILALKEYLKKN